MSYLHRFPINTLKIDQSFVSRMGETDEDAAIVRTIITLGHILGMDVVAEGIETKAQKEKLYELGCKYGQGYLFSKPLDQQKATQLLVKQFESQESDMMILEAGNQISDELPRKISQSQI